jgi:hypothetical protein
MRALILIAGALALAACGKNDRADNPQNVDETLTAENIVSNDVTAIDAVTADAANMAAESNIDEIPQANIEDAGNMSSPTKPKPKRPPATARPDEPTANTTTTASGNTTE